MKILYGLLALAAVLSATGQARSQTGPVVSNVQVTSLTDTSAIITFSSGVAAFSGVDYQPTGGSWTTVNEAYAVNHSVALTGLTPGTLYNFKPWASGAPAMPIMNFQTPASEPVVSNVQVVNLTATSATITFSSGVTVFAGVDLQPAGGSWTTINEAYALNHSVALTGLTPGTQYNFIPWASGAPAVPVMTFQTPSSAIPVISSVEVASLSATSATITFSSGIAAFGGLNYQAANGPWTTVNETTAVNHSITLNGLTASTLYNYVPWATGASGAPTSSFTTPAAGGSPASGTTNIAVGSTVIRSGLMNLGMNIEGEDYYDSGQMLRNLTFRNPGFEGETWQAILHCASVATNSCTDSNAWSQWPANFLQGATFQFIHGAAAGQTGTVLSNTAANSSANTGMTVNFSPMSANPGVGDFVVVKNTIPGNAQAGWATWTSGGATLTTDSSDISPNSPGKQALSIAAAGSGQSARVDAYFDSTDTRNFVLLNGPYQVTFRAKGLGGNNQMTVSLGRQITNGTYFTQLVGLTSGWQDYSYTFNAAETSSTAAGTVDLRFAVSGASVYLDDVALTPATVTSANPTAFRDQVVAALTSLHPGLLRYMDDGGPAIGSSIDNMLAVPFARQRSGSSMSSAVENDVPLGLQEFLQLCQTVGAEPWYVLPAAISTTEMQNLIQYFAGAASTTYGAKRSALGQAAPWTSVFPMIHLELGNEEWNNGTFPGNAINDPIAYGNQVTTIFGAAHSAPGYSASNFDLIMGSQVVNPWYTGQEAANASNYDSISVAPYMFGTFSDTSSTEAIFGPMFAEPEMWDSVSTGWMYQQAQAAATAGKNLVTYEENLSTQSGTASQSMVNSVVPSVGGGVMMADHMLLQMRDLGVKIQNVWSLPGYSNAFTNTNGGTETSPVYGTVIDMGGQTNGRRPVFLAEQLVNSAILSNMLATTVTGANPTWNQPLSTNDSVVLNGAHEIQSFAFSDGANNLSVIVINLSRTAALPVTFSGTNAPTGSVKVSQLTSANITDTNETVPTTVNSTSNTLTNFQPASPYSLPPFSVTVFQWQQ